jgi:hypothetical protein
MGEGIQTFSSSGIREILYTLFLSLFFFLLEGNIGDEWMSRELLVGEVNEVNQMGDYDELRREERYKLVIIGW